MSKSLNPNVKKVAAENKVLSGRVKPNGADLNPKKHLQAKPQASDPRTVRESNLQTATELAWLKKQVSALKLEILKEKTLVEASKRTLEEMALQALQAEEDVQLRDVKIAKLVGFVRVFLSGDAWMTPLKAALSEAFVADLTSIEETKALLTDIDLQSGTNSKT